MDDIEVEERAVYAVVAVACVPVVVGAVLAGVLDGGATLCTLLATGGVIGLFRSRRGRLPLARLMPRSRNSASRRASS